MKSTALQLCTVTIALSLAACGAHATPLAGNPPSSQSGPSLRQPMDVVGGPTHMLLSILLGDAAPDLGGEQLRSLDLGIKEIDAIENGQTTVLASFDEPQIVNVLAHQDNDGQPLTNADVSQSNYQELRLVVDLASSSAKFAGSPAQPIDFLVNVATASSVGAGATTVTTSDGPGAVDVVVTQPFSIPTNHHQSVRVDFNAFEGLALDQSGSLLVRPTLFVAPVDDMGSIKGHVLNSDGSPVSNATVVAVAADGSIGNTDWTDDTGRFRVGTLRSGTYQLLIYNAYTTAAGRNVNASGQSSSQNVIEGPTITVTGGSTAPAGSITD